jgi:hypothetical protein
MGALTLQEIGEVHQEPVVQMIEDGQFTLLDG